MNDDAKKRTSQAGPANGEEQSPKLRNVITKIISSSVIAQTLSFGFVVAGVAAYSLIKIGQYTPSSDQGKFNTIGLTVWCLAALLTAALCGFIFGIPRTRAADPVAAAQDPIQANTNLESISDWLTKILVGVGLTQLEKIPTQFHDLCRFVAASLNAEGDQSNLVSLAGAGLLIFGALGFLFGYIFARVYIAHLFRISDGSI